MAVQRGSPFRGPTRTALSPHRGTRGESVVVEYRRRCTVAVFAVQGYVGFDVVEHVARPASQRRAETCGQQEIVTLVCPQAVIGSTVEVVAADRVCEQCVISDVT